MSVERIGRWKKCVSPFSLEFYILYYFYYFYYFVFCIMARQFILSNRSLYAEIDSVKRQKEEKQGEPRFWGSFGIFCLPSIASEAAVNDVCF